jgi:uncharacterized protein YqjF (DUF2071 family)
MEWWQRWSDVVFIHCAADAEALQQVLPPSLEVDTFAGDAWISYVLFRMRLRPTGLPFLPGFSSLAELNVRTYVRRGGQRGIYFLRMYADNPFAIRAASLLTPLEYHPATLNYGQLPSGEWQAKCEAAPVNFRLKFGCRITGKPARLEPGSLDEWLLERYRLFVAGKNGSVIAADVEHPPWEAAAAVASEFECEDLVDEKHARWSPKSMHYSPGVTALFRKFRVVGEAGMVRGLKIAFESSGERKLSAVLTQRHSGTEEF